MLSDLVALRAKVGTLPTNEHLLMFPVFAASSIDFQKDPQWRTNSRCCLCNNNRCGLLWLLFSSTAFSFCLDSESENSV